MRRLPAARRRRVTSTRQRVWARSNNLPAGTVLAAAASGIAITNLLADFETQSGNLVTGATVAGIRGWVWAEAPTGATACAFGIKIGDRSFTGLPTAQALQQGPFTGGRYDDWMYRSTRRVSGGAFLIPSPVHQVAQGEALVRSKRKLPELNDTVLLFAEVGVNATAVTYYYDMNVLLLLP